MHATVVIKDKATIGLRYIYTADGTLWDRLHVPKNARAYGYTKGNVFAVVDLDAVKFEEARKSPDKKVMTYWVSLDGKRTEEIELTIRKVISDADRAKIVDGGLQSVPKLVYDT